MIYMDNAATTMMHPSVVRAMMPYMGSRFSNPSGVYKLSKSVRNDIEKAREEIAFSINALPEEIYFTSGGTESDNWALKSAVSEFGKGHIITSQIEHKAVLKSCDYLEQQGVKISRIAPDYDGMVKVKDVEGNIKSDTVMLSIMAANNEIGTIQPIKELGRLAKEYGILFHTDAVQAYTNIPIDVKAMNISAMSASGHKIRGPKGIGFLYIEKDCIKRSFINGGSQEKGLRAGTENVAGIIGLAQAVKIAMGNMVSRTAYERSMRDYMIDRILREVKDVKLNGHKTERLPGNINFSFNNVDGAKLILMLDNQGICAASGSACSAMSTSASHVLMAIGVPEKMAHGSVRFSINESITKREIDYVVDCVKKNVHYLRNLG